MKEIESQSALVIVLTFVLTACTSGDHPRVLAPVGPAAAERAVVGTDGILVVFTAPDPTAHFDSLPYRDFYSDYQVLSDAGVLLETVRNSQDGGVGEPRRLALSPGRYRIRARANGKGEVEVPVIIVANQVTKVRLDKGA